MPIETATTIAELNENWPNDDPDPIGSWDDHLRLIKEVAKNVLQGSGGAGFSRAIEAFESEINYLQGLTGPLQAQLDAAVNTEVPIGGIIMYDGLFSAIPSNFALCNGGGGTPDLSSDFIYGTNTEGEIFDVGGTADQVNITHTHQSDHSHTGSIFPDGSHTHSIVIGAGSPSNSRGDSDGVDPLIRTETSSISGAHNHTVSVTTDLGNFSTEGTIGAGLNIPPYIKLAYIQRIT